MWLTSAATLPSKWVISQLCRQWKRMATKSDVYLHKMQQQFTSWQQYVQYRHYLLHVHRIQQLSTKPLNDTQISQKHAITSIFLTESDLLTICNTHHSQKSKPSLLYSSRDIWKYVTVDILVPSWSVKCADPKEAPGL